jgi:hypothetical protein
MGPGPAAIQPVPAAMSGADSTHVTLVTAGVDRVIITAHGIGRTRSATQATAVLVCTS